MNYKKSFLSLVLIFSINILNSESVNVKKKDNYYTALMMASFNNQKYMVKLLLKHNDVNINAKDKDGHTALMWACLGDNEEIVKLLLNHKDIDVNIQNNYGETALDLADTEEIKKLIQDHINKQIELTSKSKN